MRQHPHEHFGHNWAHLEAQGGFTAEKLRAGDFFVCRPPLASSYLPVSQPPVS